VALEWLPKVISTIERGHALRVADPRSGARLCEAQDSRRPNDPEIWFSNHSGLSFTKSGFLVGASSRRLLRVWIIFRLMRPGRADHFEGGFGAGVTVAGGFERATVGFLQGIAIHDHVLIGKPHPADLELQQPGGRLIIRAAAQRFLGIRNRLPDLGGFDLFGGSVRFRRLRRPLGAWRGRRRRARRLLRFSATRTQQEAAHQRTDAHPPCL